MTEAGYRTAFSLWVIAASPLVVDADIRNLTRFQRSVLLHPGMLELHGGSRLGAGTCSPAAASRADPSRVGLLPPPPPPPPGTPLGVAAADPCPGGTVQVWGKQLRGNSTAVALVNTAGRPARLGFPFRLLGGDDSTRFQIHDVWGAKDLGASTGSFETPFEVAAHGAAVVRVSR